MVIHHDFDSISGTTFTDSAGSYNGTVSGGAALDAGTIRLGTGSASFDGSSNVNLGNTDAHPDGLADSAGLSSSGGDFTLVMDASGGTGLIAANPSASVPEPSTLVLAALGLIGLGWFGWRRWK